MRERVDHGLLECAARVLLSVRGSQVGLAEQRHGFGIEQFLETARLIQQRSRNLEVARHRVCAVEARVGRVN